MKKMVCFVLVLTVAGFVVFFLMGRRGTEATVSSSPQQTSAVPPVPVETPTNRRVREVSDADFANQQKNVGGKVYKPKSLQVGQGGETVVEIEHRLSKQLVDTPEMRRGVDYGLDGSITLRVVDSTGKPVSGATVRSAFYNQWLPENKKYFERKTEFDGKVELKNKNTGFVNLFIKKENYYTSVFRYWFLKNGYNCVKDGRWIPWNPTVEVVLKERRNPTPFLLKNVDIKLPLKNTDYGFDFMIGDLVAPNGKGEVSDILVKCWGDKPYPPSRNYSNELLFASANLNGGFIRKIKDKWSEFPSDYEAPESGYSNEFHLSTKRSKAKIFENIELAETEYLIIKIVRDGAGENGTCVRYGEIYGPLIYGIMTNDREGAGVKFSYYLNPTADDRNLEAEGRYP